MARSNKVDIGERIVSTFEKLHHIQFGKVKGDPTQMKIPKRDLTQILRNLAMLLENGLSLPRALTTLSKERSLKRYSTMLLMIRRKLESGETFSGTLAAFPKIFDRLVVQQLKVGEQSGTVTQTLGRIADQLEQRGLVRRKVLKQLSYPAIVMVVGVFVVVFILWFIIPQFVEVYADTKVPLPLITRALLIFSDIVIKFGWAVPVGLVGLVVTIRQLRKNPAKAYKMDRSMLKIPIVGGWLRDLAVLQFMDSLSIMMESGFVPVDAITASVGSIGNRAVRRAVEDLRGAVVRGERLSAEIDKHPDMFPPTVGQLVVVGEQTGNLAKATKGVREHLHKQVEHRIDVFVTMIEPVLMIGLAVTIGGLVLSIYLPMFGMADAMGANSDSGF